MKKIIAISLVAVSFAATSAFGQGYFQFTSLKSQAYDGFTTPGVSALGATVNTAFLWGAASTTPGVDSFLTQTPKTGNSTTASGYTADQAWTAILNGPFTLAQNAGTGNTLATALTSGTGVINYNAGTAFGVTGTAPSTTYTIYEIGWNSAYATPALASAAHSAVGWSAPIQYTAVTQIGFPNSMSAIPGFGIFIPVVPEPTTLALMALGSASLLLFRRKK